MRSLPSCRYVSTTVWLHHLDCNEKHREKARWEIGKDAAHFFEQILEVALYKRAS